MKKEFYKTHELHINPVVINPNGQKTQTVLIYKNGQFISASYADLNFEDAVKKAKTKIDSLKK